MTEQTEQLAQEQVLQDDTLNTADTPAVALIPELEAAIAAADPVASLKAFETKDAALAGLVTIAHTLYSLLGEAHASTVAAIATLRAYKPKQQAKPKKFDAAAEVRKLLHAKDFGGMLTLSNNEEVPENLKLQLITVSTLHTAGVPDNVLDISLKALRGMVQKSAGGSRQPAEKFDVMYNGVAYPNLMDALEAAGYSKDVPEGETKSAATKAWNKTRKPLLRDGKAELDGHVFSKGASEAEAEAEAA